MAGKLRHGPTTMLLVTLPLLLPSNLDAQGTGAATDSVVVAPGPDYAAGSLHRFFWGAHHRDVWTTEARIAVLDLQTFAGGLEPLSAGGGLQTKSLWLRGADAKTYAFRSIYKTPAKLIPKIFQQGFLEELIQDQMSTHYPYPSLVVAPLLEAVGVLHTRPSLYVLPDDPELGEFREDFAEVLGTLEERPDVDDDELASFLGARDILDGQEFVELAHADPRVQADSRAFLTARLIDVLIGDWDRHTDQWRWADIPSDGSPAWQPLPSDRDQAFVLFDGLVLRAVWPTLPMLASYGDEYDSTVRYHYQARFLDRLFLTELDRSVWDSTSVVLSERLTDEVIDGAVATLPASVRLSSGPFLSSTLQKRRDALPQKASDLYELLARQPYVHASAASDLAEVTGTANGVRVSIRDARQEASELYFDRTFYAGETKDIRIYLHGGDDRVVIRGEGRLPIRVNIIGGEGNDEFHFADLLGSVHLYDHAGDNALSGVDVTKINERPYPELPLTAAPDQPAPPRHWGNDGVPGATVGYDPDVGLQIGAAYAWRTYGFRKDPFARRVSLSGAVSTELKGEVRGEAEFRAEHSPMLMRLESYATSLLIPQFYGVGNDAELVPGAPREFYKVDNTRVVGRATVGAEVGKVLDVGAGLMAGFSNTREDPGTLFGQLEDVYGAGPFGLVGAVAHLDLTTRPPELLAAWEGKPRGRLSLRGRYLPALIDVEGAYGWLDAVGTASLPLGFRRWEVGVRAGGRKIWGDAPWFHLAYVGGNESLRGWPSQRFAGDASLYGSAELRLDLFNYRLLFPSTLGILGLVDTGRVWVDGNSPGDWHTGFGGGVWIAVQGTRTGISLTYATSSEDQGVYLSMGFPF